MFLLLFLFLVPFAGLHASQNFTRNQGQLLNTNGLPQSDVKYYTRSKTANVFLREGVISYVFATKTNSELNISSRSMSETLDTSNVRIYRMDMELVEANIRNPVLEDNLVSEYCNYYLAHRPNGITNVPSFEKITYAEIYNGIDMVCYFVNDDFKYDFVVHPGADPNQIRMRFTGGEVIMKDDGALVIQSDYGSLYQDIPITYQEDPRGNRKEIRNSYLLPGIFW